MKTFLILSFFLFSIVVPEFVFAAEQSVVPNQRGERGLAVPNQIRTKVNLKCKDGTIPTGTGQCKDINTGNLSYPKPNPTPPDAPTQGPQTDCMYADNMIQVNKISTITPDMMPKIEVLRIDTNTENDFCEVRLCSSDIVCRIGEVLISEKNIKCNSLSSRRNMCPPAESCIKNAKQVETTKEAFNSFHSKTDQVQAYNQMKNNEDNCIYANHFSGETDSLKEINDHEVTKMIPEILTVKANHCELKMCSSSKILCSYNGRIFSSDNIKCPAEKFNNGYICPSAYECIDSEVAIDKSERRAIGKHKLMSNTYDQFHEIFPDKTLAPSGRDVASESEKLGETTGSSGATTEAVQ